MRTLKVLLSSAIISVVLAISRLLFASAYENIPTKVELVENVLFKVGDSWTYSYPNRNYSHTLTVIEVKDNLVKVKTEGLDAISIYTGDGKLVALIVENKTRFQYEPPLPTLQFPLSVGKRWHEIFNKRMPGAFPMAGQIMAEIEGWANVSVPAGKFRTLKINYLMDDLESGTKNFTCWYSPEVKKSVACVYPSNPKDNFELIKFKVSK